MSKMIKCNLRKVPCFIWYEFADFFSQKVAWVSEHFSCKRLKFCLHHATFPEASSIIIFYCVLVESSNPNKDNVNYCTIRKLMLESCTVGRLWSVKSRKSEIILNFSLIVHNIVSHSWTIFALPIATKMWLFKIFRSVNKKS